MKTLLLFVLHLTSYCGTRCQTPVVCRGGSNIPSSVIKETDPPGTVIFRASLSAGHSWKIRYTDRLEPKTFYGNAMAFDPPDGNNTKECKYKADGTGTSICELKLAHTIDAEVIKSEHGVSPAGSSSSNFVLTYTAECKQNSQSLVIQYEVFVTVRLVNEYSPKFTRSSVTVDFAKDELVGGTVLYDLKNTADDDDVGRDGWVNFYILVNKTDLIAQIDMTQRVVLSRKITSDDLKNGNCLRFLFQAWDSGNPRKAGYLTLTLNVQNNDGTWTD